MTRFALFFWLSCPCQLAIAQLPNPTQEGRKALDDLIAHCVARGGFRFSSPLSWEPSKLYQYSSNERREIESLLQAHRTVHLGDAAKLKAAVHERRQLLTPALRDTLIATAQVFVDDFESPPYLTLVGLVAEQMNDNRARAFAAQLEGSSAHAKGRFAEARQRTEEALRLFSALKDNFSEARCRTSLGSISHAQGLLAESLEHHRAALIFFRRAFGEKDPNVAACLSRLALVFLDLDKEDEALTLLQQSQNIEEGIAEKDDSRIAEGLVNLGTVYARRGDHDKALKQFQKAALIFRSGPSGRPARLADVKLTGTLAALGNAYLNIGDYARSQERHREALEICTGLHGDFHPEVARSLHNLASVVHAQGDYGQVTALYLQALRIREKVLGKKHPDVASTLNELGYLHAAKKEYELATGYSRRALDIRRQSYGEHHEEVARSWQALSQIHYLRGDYSKSLDLNANALQALRRSADAKPLSLDHLTMDELLLRPYTVDVLLHRVRCLTKNGEATPSIEQTVESDRLLAVAAELVDQSRQRHLETPESKLMLGDQRSSLYHRWIASSHLLHTLEKKDKHLQTAFRAAELGTARLFLEQLSRVRGQAPIQKAKELRNQEDARLTDLRGVEIRIDKEQAKSETERDTALLKNLYAERKKHEEALRRVRQSLSEEEPQYAAWMHPTPCSLTQARACLNPGEIALVYIVGDPASYLLTLEDASQPGPGLAIRQLPGAATLAEHVASLTDTETLGLPARARRLGRQAFDVLLGPCKDFIRDKSLVIVAGGQLCFLPFELLVEEDNKHVVEKHRIRYAPSLTALHFINLWKQTRTKPETPFFAVGDPHYENDLPRLEHSGYEVVEIAKTLGADDDLILTRDRASKAELRRLAEANTLAKARYVHFATHGILGVDRGKQPALVLNQTNVDIDESFLRLDEIAALKLNADLVVLSACKSGQGRLHQGEGVTGLARAFLYAGSKGVVCSLWSVDDRETSNLMVDFYRHLQKGRPAAEALREAQLAMMRTGRAPLYWAPFIVIGE